MPTKKMPKNAEFYTCEVCDFKCSKKSNFEKHNLTGKHAKQVKILHNTTNLEQKNADFKNYTCECGKKYKHHSSLWAHKKKGCLTKNCGTQNKEESVNSSVEEHVVVSNNPEEEMKELKTMFIKMIEINQDLQKQIVEICKEGKVTNNTTNNNTTNNKFNLNVFLNEKCKDALNLTDFISNLNVGFSDFENFGKIGYSNSISHIFIRGLKELDVYKRPIHCSDLKREIIHIKDDNTWKKDDEKEQMIKAIKMIEHKNIKQIPEWIKAHPAHTDIRSKKFDEYSKMLDQSMGEYEDEDNQKNYQKIIRSVAKEILVEKDS